MSEFIEYAECRQTQRRRLVRGRSQEDVVERAKDLAERWVMEVPTKSQSGISYWKSEVLRHIVVYPAPPKPATQSSYRTIFGSMTSVRQFRGTGGRVQTDETVYLEDFDEFRTSVEEDCRFRLPFDNILVPEYPVDRPTTPPFECKTPHAPTRPEPETKQWFEYIFSGSPLAGRKADRVLREQVREFNLWVTQLAADRQEYWEAKKREYDRASEAAINAWNQHKAEWDSEAMEDARVLASLIAGYHRKTPSDVSKYFEAQLDKVPLYHWMERQYELQFDDQEGILLLELNLPNFGHVDISKFRRLKSRVDVIRATQKERHQFICNISYFLVLRMMWEITQVDPDGLVRLIACNGYVVQDDPATGNVRRDVVLTICVNREDLARITLSRVDPGVCFRGFKGISGARLDELVPVRPVLTFNRDDKRFVPGRDVLSSTQGANLAAMEWQDFEHLIRQLFEKEFGGGGAEVRVTQASRDRGVDAVVFDPDPLRGGKLVIQAKRYTSTVDVSAVRDLYGTILNEGANRGILVTTSTYGRDSYEFAKDKPISLVDGSNLLHLLSKHGYHVNIDIEEARRRLKSED